MTHRTPHQGKQENVILWHPELHRHHGESLYFFLLWLREFERKTTPRKLFDILDAKLGVKGFSLYYLLSEWDFLVRVWLDGDAVESIQEEFNSLKANRFLREWSLFQCSRINHWAFDGGKEQRAQLLKDVKDHSPAALDDVQSGRNASLAAKLQGKGVLRKGPIWFPDRAKFYVNITEPHLRIAHLKDQLRDQVIPEVLKGLESRFGKRKLGMLSVYEGRGFGWLLVKGVADDHTTALQVALALRECIVQYDSTTATLLIGERVPPERDHINFLKANRTMVDPELHAALPALVQRASVSAPVVSLDEVASYVRSQDFFRAVAEPYQEAVQKLVIALVYNSPSGYSDQPLSNDILRNLFSAWESALREVLRPLLVVKASGDATRQGQIADDLGMPKDRKQWPLGKLLEWIPKLLGLNALTLDARQQKILNDATNLRDLAAHGVISHTRPQEWQRTVTIITEFVVLYDTLLTLSREAIESWKPGLSRRGKGES